jgi:hypothetical protein
MANRLSCGLRRTCPFRIAAGWGLRPPMLRYFRMGLLDWSRAGFLFLSAAQADMSRLATVGDEHGALRGSLLGSAGVVERPAGEGGDGHDGLLSTARSFVEMLLQLLSSINAYSVPRGPQAQILVRWMSLKSPPCPAPSRPASPVPAWPQRSRPSRSAAAEHGAMARLGLAAGTDRVALGLSLQPPEGAPTGLRHGVPRQRARGDQPLPCRRCFIVE